jgi:hypothetical protein
VHAGDGVGQFVLGQRAGDRFDLMAVLGQPRRRVGVNVLQQQGP